MNLIKQDLIMLRTKNGEPGVVMYNKVLNILVDDFHSTRMTSNHIPYDLHVVSKDPIQNNDPYYDMFTQVVVVADNVLRIYDRDLIRSCRYVRCYQMSYFTHKYKNNDTRK